MTVDFVKDLAAKDDRFVIVQPKTNIKQTLEEKGYPFKSKLFAHKVATYDHSGMCKTIMAYLDGTRPDGSPSQFVCPAKLRGVFTEERKERLKISEKCCDEFKKKPAHEYEKESGRTIPIIGVRQSEGGIRKFQGGCVLVKDDKLIKFKPLNPVSEDFMKWYRETRGIKLSPLYYPPFNMTRTGCRACPFARDLQKELDMMEEYLPNERKACEAIFGKVYDEYRSLNYRLRNDDGGST